MDNLSAHKGADIRRWAKKNKVELCFTPTHASWANPIEAHFGPLRQFTIANSNHPSHTMQTHTSSKYVERHPHPHDARARLLVLTETGWAATRAADQAARAAVAPWREVLGQARFSELVADLTLLAPPGPIRPAW